MRCFNCEDYARGFIFRLGLTPPTGVETGFLLVWMCAHLQKEPIIASFFTPGNWETEKTSTCSWEEGGAVNE